MKLMTDWDVQKGATILSILTNSSSQRCNAFKLLKDSFLTQQMLQGKSEVLSCGGWSVSLESIYHIVQSVTHSLKESLKKLSDLGLFALVYDNMDFNFKTKEPSDQNQGHFRA